MKTKQIVVIVLLFSLFGCTAIQNFNFLSKEIYKEQKKQKCGLYPQIIYSHSNEISNKMDFINYKQDTVCFLESFNIETGQINRAIWTKRGKLEYISLGNKIIEYRTDLFIKRLYIIVENWDTTTIKNEQQNGNSNLNGANMMFAMRVFIRAGKQETQCVNFKEFFDVQKDFQ